MSQCHDDYAELKGESVPAPPAPVRGAQCHDVPDVLDITVLIAESDPVTQAEICRLLEKDVRFGAISKVPTGDEALTLALEVDVVVVDLRTVRGLGALGTISQIARRPVRPPIVGLARHGEEWLSLAARCEGADDIIDWPQEASELAQRLLTAVHLAYA